MDELLEHFNKQFGQEVQKREIKVDQTWVERAINFSKAYASIMTAEEVTSQFKKSEFTRLEDFLYYNKLYIIDDSYIKVSSNVTVLKTDIVEKCFENRIDKSLTMESFMQNQEISRSGDCYYRVVPSFPKVKLLEIVSQIPWRELLLPDSSFVDYLTMCEMFHDEESTLKLMAIG